MTTGAQQKNRILDVRFIPLDSDNPYALIEHFSEEKANAIKDELHIKYGHLAEDIAKSHGHIRVYTQGNETVGQPQFVNFNRAVWDKMYQPHEEIHNTELEKQRRSMDEILDHENYNDV